MGSYDVWGDKFCATPRAVVQEYPNGEMLFFTLPYCFERLTYVVPRQLPPWAEDMIDTSFARNMTSCLKGSSIYMANSVASKWRRKITKAYMERLFDLLMHGGGRIDGANLKPRAGRPRIIDEVAHAYAELCLAEYKLSWKEKHARVETHLGERFSRNATLPSPQIRRIIS